jgi:hypothetical protein
MLALAIFSFGSFEYNIGSIWLGRYLALAFIILVFISSSLIIYEISKIEVQKFRRLRLIFIGLTPIIYTFTSTLAASWFLQASNLNIDESPVVGLGWKLIIFFMFYFMFLQFFTFCSYLYVLQSAKINYLRKIIAAGMIVVTTILMQGMNQWDINIMKCVLDLTTKFEWHDRALCGTDIIKEPTERYFGYDAEKYTVYFSDRKGKWGFEELICKNNAQNNYVGIRIPITQSDMKKWFKDV